MIITSFHYVFSTSFWLQGSHNSISQALTNCGSFKKLLSQIVIPPYNDTSFSWEHVSAKFLTWSTTYFEPNCNFPLIVPITKKQRPYVNGFLLGCYDHNSLMEREPLTSIILDANCSMTKSQFTLERLGLRSQIYFRISKVRKMVSLGLQYDNLRPRPNQMTFGLNKLKILYMNYCE